MHTGEWAQKLVSIIHVNTSLDRPHFNLVYLLTAKMGLFCFIYCFIEMLMPIKSLVEPVTKVFEFGDNRKLLIVHN